MPTLAPSVSVILPFRNAELSLRESVESILHQTHTDFELLLIDNNSSDQSTTTAKDFAQKDERIRYITEYHVGIVHALHTGLAQATCKYIARMDADDIAYPERLQRQYQYLKQNPSVDVVACQVSCGESEKSEGIMTYVNWANALVSHEDMFLNRFIDSPIIHPTVMFRKSLLAQLDSYREGSFPEDFELWLRWMEAGVRFYKLPEVLLYWRDSENRLTRKDARYKTEAFYRIKTAYLVNWLQKYNPFHPKVVVWGGGRKSRQRASLLEKNSIEITAYIDIIPDKTTAKPCIHYLDIAVPGSYFILSYVSKRGQREKIKDYLQQKGYQEGKHFLLIG